MRASVTQVGITVHCQLSGLITVEIQRFRKATDVAKLPLFLQSCGSHSLAKEKNLNNGRMEQSRVVKNYGQSSDSLIDSFVEYTLCGFGYVIEAKSPTLPSALFS